MKHIGVILFVSLGLMGCLPAVDGKNFYLSEQNKVRTTRDCEIGRAHV